MLVAIVYPKPGYLLEWQQNTWIQALVRHVLVLYGILVNGILKDTAQVWNLSEF